MASNDQDLDAPKDEATQSETEKSKSQITKLIILTENDAGVIDLGQWKVTKKFKCNSASLKEAKDAVKKIDKKIPVHQEHIVPGTDCSFMVETYDTQFIYIRNIESGQSK